MAVDKIKIISFADRRISKSLLKPEMLVNLNMISKDNIPRISEVRICFPCLGTAEKWLSLSIPKRKNHHYHHHNCRSQTLIRHLGWTRSSLSYLSIINSFNSIATLWGRHYVIVPILQMRKRYRGYRGFTEHSQGHAGKFLHLAGYHFHGPKVSYG